MSVPAAEAPPTGPGVPNQDLCGKCDRDIRFPCVIYRLMDCPDCTGKLHDCHQCNGAKGRVLKDGNFADCNACVATGSMVKCTVCRGSGGVRCGTCKPNQHCDICKGGRHLDCVACDGNGLRRCVMCDAAGTVEAFSRLCAGDVGRRHPNSKNIPRGLWSRAEEMPPSH